jgi:hypothetical protein
MSAADSKQVARASSSQSSDESTATESSSINDTDYYCERQQDRHGKVRTSRKRTADSSSSRRSTAILSMTNEKESVAESEMDLKPSYKDATRNPSEPANNKDYTTPALVSPFTQDDCQEQGATIKSKVSRVLLGEKKCSQDESTQQGGDHCKVSLTRSDKDDQFDELSWTNSMMDDLEAEQAKLKATSEAAHDGLIGIKVDNLELASEADHSTSSTNAGSDGFFDTNSRPLKAENISYRSDEDNDESSVQRSSKSRGSADEDTMVSSDLDNGDNEEEEEVGDSDDDNEDKYDDDSYSSSEATEDNGNDYDEEVEIIHSAFRNNSHRVYHQERTDHNESKAAADPMTDEAGSIDNDEDDEDDDEECEYVAARVSKRRRVSHERKDTPHVQGDDSSVVDSEQENDSGMEASYSSQAQNGDDQRDRTANPTDSYRHSDCTQSSPTTYATTDLQPCTVHIDAKGLVKVEFDGGKNGGTTRSRSSNSHGSDYQSSSSNDLDERLCNLKRTVRDYVMSNVASPVTRRMIQTIRQQLTNYSFAWHDDTGGREANDEEIETFIRSLISKYKRDIQNRLGSKNSIRTNAVSKPKSKTNLQAKTTGVPGSAQPARVENKVRSNEESRSNKAIQGAPDILFGNNGQNHPGSVYYRYTLYQLIKEQAATNCRYSTRDIVQHIRTKMPQSRFFLLKNDKLGLASEVDIGEKVRHTYNRIKNKGSYKVPDKKEIEKIKKLVFPSSSTVSVVAKALQQDQQATQTTNIVTLNRRHIMEPKHCAFRQAVASLAREHVERGESRPLRRHLNEIHKELGDCHFVLQDNRGRHPATDDELFSLFEIIYYKARDIIMKSQETQPRAKSVAKPIPKLAPKNDTRYTDRDVLFGITGQRHLGSRECRQIVHDLVKENNISTWQKSYASVLLERLADRRYFVLHGNKWCETDMEDVAERLHSLYDSQRKVVRYESQEKSKRGRGKDKQSPGDLMDHSSPSNSVIPDRATRRITTRPQQAGTPRVSQITTATTDATDADSVASNCSNASSANAKSNTINNSTASNNTPASITTRRSPRLANAPVQQEPHTDSWSAFLDESIAKVKQRQAEYLAAEDFAALPKHYKQKHVLELLEKLKSTSMVDEYKEKPDQYSDLYKRRLKGFESKMRVFVTKLIEEDE